MSTNNPKKIHGITGYGLTVSDQVSIHLPSNPHNERYLRAKATRLGHTIHHQGLPVDDEMFAEEHRHDAQDAAGSWLVTGV